MIKWKTKYVSEDGHYEIEQHTDLEWNGSTYKKVTNWVLCFKENEIFADDTLKSVKEYAERHPSRETTPK